MVLVLFDSKINEMHLMLSKVWMDMKWMAANCALTMLGMNDLPQGPANDQDPDLEIDADPDHVIEEDLGHDLVDGQEDQEVVPVAVVETEEVDQNLMIDQDQGIESLNQDQPSVIEVDHVDAIAVDHATSKS